MPCTDARSRSIDAASSRSERSSNEEYSRSIRPASTFERSRISLSSSSRCLPDPWMSRRYSSWRSLMSPNIRSSSTSEKPRTAFSGVRSSWDMLARNSDLCRLASSSSALCTFSSRKSCALSRARADWLANVSSRSRVSSEKSPVRLRRTTSEPTIWSSLSIGTATTERHPASKSTCRCGSSSTAPRSVTARGRRCLAARPTSVSSRSMRTERSRSMTLGSVA